jgi:hypothetical protein
VNLVQTILLAAAEIGRRIAEAVEGGDPEALRRLLPADFVTSGDGIRLVQAAERARAERLARGDGGA